MDRIKKIWQDFENDHPKVSKWVREGGLFFLVSALITVVRGILVSILQIAFSFMGTEAIGFPNLQLNIFGIEFSWYIIGANEEQGGVSYFVAFLVSLWICEIINFLMQRRFVFRSSGKIGRQAILYFIAFAIVTCVVNAISNIWIGVASYFVSPFIYNLGTTFLTGGVAMVVFFFANRYIFNNSER